MNHAFTVIGASRLRRGVTIMLVGVILGSVLSLLRVGKALDRLTLDNAALIDEVERLAAELASRERALTAAQGVPVRSIEIDFDNDLPEHRALHIESTVRTMLHPLLGEDVDTLNPALIEKTLERSIRLEQEEVTIVPIRLILGSTIRVRLRVVEGRPGTSP